MRLFPKSGWTLVAVCVMGGLSHADDRLMVKGFYQEDGTYVAQRTIDPIQTSTTAFPSLSSNLKQRKKELRNFYEGQVVTAKVSLPACRSGLVIYTDLIGKSNVDLYRKMSRYGASIEKGGKAVITEFKVGKKQIEIELNDGGYGDLKDVSTRVLQGVVSLGLSELRDFSRERYQRGSRVVIKSRKSFSATDLDFEELQKSLALVFEL